MDTKPIPPIESEVYNGDSELIADELQSSSGSRLTWFAGSVVVLLALGYVLSPKQESLAAPTAPPTFMLEGAAVTAARVQPAPEAPAAVGAAGAVVPVAAPATALKAAGAPAGPGPKVAVAAALVPAVAPAAPEIAAPVAVAAPAPAPVVPAAPAVPVAPATVPLAGRVLNEDGKPLVGATVLLKGSSQGTSTDAAGNYSLEVPTGDNTLLFGYGGYEDEVVHARGGQPVSVTLTPRPDAKKRRR